MQNLMRSQERNRDEREQDRDERHNDDMMYTMREMMKMTLENGVDKDHNDDMMSILMDSGMDPETMKKMIYMIQNSDHPMKEQMMDSMKDDRDSRSDHADKIKEMM